MPGMHGHISDGETATEIHCGISSMTSANISDGNKRSHPTGMKNVYFPLSFFCGHVTSFSFVWQYRGEKEKGITST